MTPEEKQFRANMKWIKRQFLRSKGLDGATLGDFQAFVVKDHKSDPDRYKLLPLLYSAAREAWGSEAPWERDDDDDLFSVAGLKISSTITVRDHLPGKGDTFRKVDAEAATLHQFREQSILHMEIAARGSARAAREFEVANAVIRRAGGDVSRLLSDFKDPAEAAA